MTLVCGLCGTVQALPRGVCERLSGPVGTGTLSSCAVHRACECECVLGIRAAALPIVRIAHVQYEELEHDCAYGHPRSAAAQPRAARSLAAESKPLPEQS